MTNWLTAELLAGVALQNHVGNSVSWSGMPTFPQPTSRRDAQQPVTPPPEWLLTTSTTQVDGVLLSHPGVAEAVAFASPDEKFGEVVAAAIVPSGNVTDPESFIADLKKHAAAKLAKFKVQPPDASICIGSSG